MTKTQHGTVTARHDWHLHLNRTGLRVGAGRHLRVRVSLTLLTWGVGMSGLAATASHWIRFLP
ncbi:hypothetical protein LG634_06245 [Streptomyces bambusae]|uniref:hypothetical protein n=1 Tax=Streptomyces bambusae TaxID=1550616 RepID=UPI001CFCEC52|nr:hypothetical protein [Streptomyces bambusae]MCB5164435.1 hypothetical protein [Streptomyces bambusae]